MTTLGRAEPDRVPLLLAPVLQGARELGLSIRDYFSRAEHVVEGQCRLRDKFGLDAVSSWFYAATDVEAWGAGIRYFEDGPPNAGAPLVEDLAGLARLEPPCVGRSPRLAEILRATRLLRERLGDVPIVGAFVSPFSLPVVQLGFERYLELLLSDDPLFDRLMAINHAFAVDWANAQLDAGATAIACFNPLASSTITPPEVYRAKGLPVDRATLSRIEGAVLMGLASGRAQGAIDLVAETGAKAIGVSALDDLRAVKAAAAGRLAILGNLDGIEMCRWSEADAEAAVKTAIAAAGPGGGFLLADSHGEVPWQVADGVIAAIADAVERWGRYPLDWCDGR
jgi:uroporphyrinogen decarboxylase